MLKSPVMIRMLLILTSVSLRYFKAIYKESECILIKKYTRLQLKKEIQEISLWLKMFFHDKKRREDNLILIYVMTLDELLTVEKFLEKVVQFRWLNTPTSLSPLQFLELGIDHISDYNGSWMKISWFLLKSYLVTAHSWTNWLLSVVLKLLILFQVLLPVEVIPLERTLIWVSLMLSFTI